MHYFLPKNLTPVLFAVCVLAVHTSFAQCVSSVSIEVDNPSFEGTPVSHQVPLPWSSCLGTSDTQPGSWGVTELPSDGNTYLGLVANSPGWLEGASQELIIPLASNTVYSFEIDLSATTASGGGINPNAFASLEVWGGDTLCDQGELLWTSPIIDHVGWVTYPVNFTPSSSHDFIYLIVSGGNNAYLLADNIKEPSQPSTLSVLTPIDSVATSCSLELAGSVDQLYIDSLLIEGAFQNSPISIATNDPTWSVDLSYTEGGYEGISLSAYATDTVTGNQLVCSQVNLTIEINAPEPNFSVIGNCSNIPYEFNDLSIPFNTDTIVSWNWGFTGLGNSTDQNPTVLLDTSGFVDVQLVVESSDGCIEDTTISVEVVAAPDANFTFTEVCQGYSTNFHDLSDEGADLLNSWTWDFADGSTSTLEDPVHTYIDTGEYYVQLVVTDYNGCTDSIVQGVEVFACTSINEPKREDYFSFRYDPSIGLHITALGSEKLKGIRSYSVNGKLIVEEQLHQTEYVLNQKNFNPGVYVIEVISERNQSFKEFLVIP